jgi:hypothetical protein
MNPVARPVGAPAARTGEHALASRLLTASSPPQRRSRALAISLAALVLVALASAGLTSSFGAAPTDAAPAATLTLAALRPALSADQLAAGHGCPVTGDLVFSPEGTTGGNPDVVARALCGR